MDDDLNDWLEKRVDDARNESRVPSLLATVGLGGRRLAWSAAGYSDIENQIAPTTDSSYRVGSITKTFTAALTLLLADRGEIGIDDGVERYLPAVPFAHISLRMLLSHTSGLQREAPTNMWETMLGPSSTQLRDSYARVEFVARPGQRWHYSNLGYAILGQVVESVLGGTVESAITRELLAPLGLTNTVWAQPPGAAVGYRLDPTTPSSFDREPIMDQRAIGAGGQMWSTTDDLIRWAHTLSGGDPTVVPLRVVEDMHTATVMVDTVDWTRGWGLGLILERHPQGILSGHTGAMPGFQSALLLDPVTGLSAAVVANATRGIKPNVLAAELLQQFAAAVPDHSDARPDRLSTCPPHIQALLGTWWCETDETIFRWEFDGLHAHLASDPDTTDTRFTEEGPGRFRAAQGRLKGELLVVVDTARGMELRWATYPVTRSPR
ncbi:serine hydrolase domain-containing protein [Nocardia takedensis]